MKRASENPDIPTISKKSRGDEDNDKLSAFVSWCLQNGMTINEKVKACWDGTCAQYGMLAVHPISEGECLFEIPRSILLSPDTCEIKDLLKQESKELKSESGWIPQLLTLMYESLNPSTKWKPYLSLFPNYDDLDLPMYWTKDERKELIGTGVPEATEKDLQSLEKEFNSIVLPFVKKHQNIFNNPRHTDLEYYKKMVGFIMAYSFSEPNNSEDSDDEDSIQAKPTPMMVPMADILNHVASNNAYLDFGTESLKMIAQRDIEEKEEIFNTYGELSNFQLFHMYGFAEAYPKNYYDTVELPLTRVYSYLQNCDFIENNFEERWDALRKNHVITDGGAFVIGEEGILTEEEMLEMLKVLTMTPDAFEEYKKSDDWVEDDEDDITLTKDDIKWLPEKWRQIIQHLATCALEEYGGRNMKSEEELLEKSNWDTLSRRQQFCVYVRYGQMKLLDSLKNSCLQNFTTSSDDS